MRDFPQKITSENFNEAARKLITASSSIEKCNKTKKIVKPIGSLLFVFLSFIFIYGAIYDHTTGKEKIVFAKLTPVTKIWTFFSDLLLRPEMKWYVYTGVLVVAAFVLPLLVSAILKILVVITHKTNLDQLSVGETATKAKKLHVLAEKTHNDSLNITDRSEKKPYKLIFVLLIAVFLAYAFFALKMFHVKMLLGFAVSMVLLYYVYGLLVNLFFALNGLFYKKRYVPDVTSVTEEYWVSVDSVEKNRRNVAKKREQEAQQREREASKKVSTPSQSINEYDSFTWTAEYVRNNESKCSDIALSVLNVSKELLAEGDYSGAAAGFDKVVRALELLKEIDRQYYLPPLFANCYALSKIFAFGLGNKNSACKNAKKACDYASQCNSDSAKRDLAVMTDFYQALASAKSLDDIEREFDIDFPYDVLSMN